MERYEDTLIHCLGPLGFAGVVQQATAQAQLRMDPAGFPPVDAAALAGLARCPPGAGGGAGDAGDADDAGAGAGDAAGDRALLARCAAKIAAAGEALPGELAAGGRSIACSYKI